MIRHHPAAEVLPATKPYRPSPSACVAPRQAILSRWRAGFLLAFPKLRAPPIPGSARPLAWRRGSSKRQSHRRIRVPSGRKAEIIRFDSSRRTQKTDGPTESQRTGESGPADREQSSWHSWVCAISDYVLMADTFTNYEIFLTSVNGTSVLSGETVTLAPTAIAN